MELRSIVPPTENERSPDLTEPIYKTVAPHSIMRNTTGGHRRHKLRTGVENSLALLWFLRWIGVIARLVHPYNSDQTLHAKHNYRNKYRNSLVVDSLKDKE